MGLTSVGNKYGIQDDRQNYKFDFLPIFFNISIESP